MINFFSNHALFFGLLIPNLNLNSTSLIKNLQKKILHYRKYFWYSKKQTGWYGGGGTTGMDTKSLIIDIATTLFQKKGYLGVGVNEILKACSITKGSLYHHFPNGKEELLIACLQSMSEAITTDIEVIFKRYLTTQEATQAMIEKLVADFEREGTITGYTFSSIVSEMAALSEPVLNACSGPLHKDSGALFGKVSSRWVFERNCSFNCSNDDGFY